MGNRISLGMAINDALNELGLSTHQFAKMLCVTPSEVYRWTSEGISPSSKYFDRVIEELGIDPRDHGFTADDLAAAKERKKQVSTPRSDGALDLGLDIKMARMKARMSQDELTRRAGLSGGGNLCHYERGTSIPKVGSLLKICAVLGLDETEMLKKRDAALAGATPQGTK